MRRRQFAARVSQAVSAAASPTSSARSTVPSDSSRPRNAGRISSRFMRRISVHSPGSLAPGGSYRRHRGRTTLQAARAARENRRAAMRRFAASDSWRRAARRAGPRRAPLAPLEHRLPEVHDLPHRLLPVPARRHVDDGPAKQIGTRRLESVSMRPGEGMTPREALCNPIFSARATIDRFTDPTSVTTASRFRCGTMVSSWAMLAAGGRRG